MLFSDTPDPVITNFFIESYHALFVEYFSCLCAVAERSRVLPLSLGASEVEMELSAVLSARLIGTGVFGLPLQFEVKDVVDALGWAASYTEQVSRMGFQSARLEPSIEDCAKDAISNYASLQYDNIKTWLPRLRENQGDAEMNDGVCYTPLPRDLFQILMQQLDLAIRSSSDDLIFRVAIGVLTPATASWLDEYATDVREDEQEMLNLCAYTNNMETCVEMMERFLEKIEETITDTALLTELDMLPMQTGFSSVRQATTEGIVELLFADLSPMLRGLADTEWVTEHRMITLLGTLDDYFNDLQSWLLPFSFKKLCFSVPRLGVSTI